MPTLPDAEFLGKRLQPGWHRPTRGLIEKFGLHMDQGLAAPSAPHLYLPAAQLTAADLRDRSVIDGIRMLEAFTREGSGSPIFAMGMAYPQLDRAARRNVRVLAAQKGAIDAKVENRTDTIVTLRNARYKGIKSAGKTLRIESCYSAPGIGVRIMRWNEIMLYVPGQAPQRVTGIDAWVLQHEIDHWNGILCTTVARKQSRLLYYVPPEWHTTFTRGGFTPNWPVFQASQYRAMRSGAFDLTPYLRLP